MKKEKINLIPVIIICAIVAGLIALIAWSLINKASNSVNYNDYNLNSYIGPNEYNGEIGDHVKGAGDKAEDSLPVYVIEYADYQCPGCASINPRIVKLAEEYKGKVGFIYRNFLLSYHQNGTAAASAAEAAGLQGYWERYANNLFTNQSSWEYASASERGTVFTQYFTSVTEGNGDLAKFQEDMGSTRVKKKISFDMGIAEKIDVSATPSFYLNGEKLDIQSTKTEDEFYKLFRDKINAALAEKGIK